MKRILLIAMLVFAVGNGTLVQLVELMRQMPQEFAPDRGPTGAIGELDPPGLRSSISGFPPVRLTTGGCCTQPFWSPDGKQVRYIDRPQGGKLGIYGVTVDANVGAASAPTPALVSERVEDSRIVGPYRIETATNATTLVRLSDGKAFKVPAQGRGVQFSPDFKRIAWSISNDNASPEQQVAAIWVANVDGTAAKKVATQRRGGVGGWLSNDALLISGQVGQDRADQALWALTLTDGKLREIVRAERLRSALLSPSGRWIAYYTAFAENGENGLWVVDTQGGKAQKLPAEAFGAYQWRAGAEDRLVIVPFKPTAQHHEFWQLNPATLAFTQLTSAADAPIKIANGDWRVSPDGRYVAYVENQDRNIWVVGLP